jgi:hypothetical protein
MKNICFSNTSAGLIVRSSTTSLTKEARMKAVKSLSQIATALIMTLITATALAGGRSADRPATPAEKVALAKTLISNPVIKAAYNDGRKDADSCEFKIDKAIQLGGFETGTAFKFEASINCSISADEYTGGGVIYWVNLKGGVFGLVNDGTKNNDTSGPMIDPLQITIQHAG